MHQKGRASITDSIRKNIVRYSGDTPVDNCSKWDKSEILIHESTFIKGDSDEAIRSHEGKHSTLEDVMQMVSEIKVEKLILAHFSARYSAAQIDKSIKKWPKN